MNGYITSQLRHDRIAVRCRRQKNKFVLDVDPDEPICMAKAGTEIRRLEINETVETPDGENIKATGQFWVSCGTIDPWHLIFDMF